MITDNLFKNAKICMLMVTMSNFPSNYSNQVLRKLVQDVAEIDHYERMTDSLEMYFESMDDARNSAIDFDQNKVQSCFLNLKFVDGETETNEEGVKSIQSIMDPEIYIRQSVCTNFFGSVCSSCLPIAIAIVLKSDNCDESLSALAHQIKTKTEQLNEGSGVKIFRILDVPSVHNCCWKPIDLFIGTITHDMYRFMFVVSEDSVTTSRVSLKCVSPYWNFSGLSKVSVEEAFDCLSKELGKMKDTASPLGPDELLEMDIIDFNSIIDGRYSHALLIFDCFSNWLEICLIETNDTDTVIDNIFKTWTSRYGNPIAIVSGPQLKDLETWTDEIGISYKMTTTRNGFSKNFTSMFLDLNKCLFPKPNVEVLLKFVYQFNRTIHSGLESTPFNIHHCRPAYMFMQ